MGKDAVLLIDRGSREQTVQDELKALTERVRQLGGFDVGEFALLEVRGPTIEEGLGNCAEAGAENVVVFPYFLHNGLKCHLALDKVRALSLRSGMSVVVIDTPLGVDQMLVDLVLSTLRDLKATRTSVREEDCQVLLMGHGSSYPQERSDFQLIARSVKDQSGYGGVEFCFLELASPTIPEGIGACLDRKPELLLLMPYFLHFGAHLQRDVPRELENISQRVSLSNVLSGKHLGASPLLAELVVKRIRQGTGRAQ